MKPMNNNQIFLGSNDPETDPEWMLQSEQITGAALIRALVHDYYPRIYQLAAFYLGEHNAPQNSMQAAPQDTTQQGNTEAARQISEQALLQVVMNRHRYWGEPELPAWILGIALRTFQKAANAQQTTHSNSTPPYFQPASKNGITQIDPEMERSIDALDKKQALLLLLRYGYKLDIPGIAHVLRANQRSVLAELQTIRKSVRDELAKNEQGLASISPNIMHRYIHRQLHADIDGCANPEEKETILEHLKECPACQAYAAGLDRFEKRLAGFLSTIWPDPVFVENEESFILAETTRRLENGGIRRKISITEKESAVIGLVILMVVAVGWGIKVMAPNPDRPASVNSVPKRTVIEYSSATPTPSVSDPGALPTNDPGSERAFFNSNAIAPPKTFIDLKQTVQITDPVTDTYDVRQSGFDTMEVLERYWGSVSTSSDQYLLKTQGVSMTPFEIVRYINSDTNLKAVSRVGGDIETIKHFLTAGFPIIIERGFDGVTQNGESNWTGQFDVVNGYDDAQQSLTMLSSYQVPVVYTDIFYGSFVQQWRAFNYEYLVIYKPTQEEMVNQILGSQVDTVKNYRQASEKASMDAYNSIYVRDQFFSWFNLGTSLTYSRNYKDAVTAFDQAFILYKRIPKSELPWRIFWYQTDFYQAYYGIGRYQDVIDLATMIINGPGSSQTEDSYYWRALAEEALGRKASALLDLKALLKINPSFKPVIMRLDSLISGS